MKKKLVFLMAAIMVFGLAFAVYAFTTGTTTSDKAASCCNKKDGESCPMKAGKTVASTGEKASCCGCDCCADCPMKGAHAEATKADGKSCPMTMKGEGHKMAEGAVHVEKGENACCGCSCSCCAGEKKADAAV
jgi:hypothetical protein